MATTKVEPPHASVVVLNHNGERYLGTCLRSLFDSDYPSFEVVVVDNASTDGSLKSLAFYRNRIRLIRNRRNLLSTRGLNRGIRVARAPIIVLLDTDTEVRSDWLRELIRPLQTDPAVAVTGSRLLYPGGTILQHGGGYVDASGFAHHYGHGLDAASHCGGATDVEYVTGAATAIRRSFLQQVGGGLDPLFPFYYEDCDICHQARRLGYRVLYVPSSVALHHESASLGRGSHRYLFQLHRGRFRYLLKNGAAGDLLRHGLARERQWLRQFPSSEKHLGPWGKALASTLPALPRIVLRRLVRRLSARGETSGPLRACVMASSLFVRADGALSCWCDHGKDTELVRLTECALRLRAFQAQNHRALRRLRRAFLDGGRPHPSICSSCVMSGDLRPADRSEQCWFMDVIHVEPSILCRLRCRDCKQDRRRTPPLLPLSFFEALVDNLLHGGVQRVSTFVFEGLGEPLLNPAVPAMIAAAKRAYPTAETVLTTNGNVPFTEGLACAPLDRLRVSIDGTDQKSYARYRRGGSFGAALAFLRAASESRTRTGWPRAVEWRYILFGWNDSDAEIQRAAAMAGEAGVECSFDISFASDATARFTPETLDRRLAVLAPTANNISRVRTGHCGGATTPVAAGTWGKW